MVKNAHLLNGHMCTYNIVTGIKEIYFEIHLYIYQESCPLALPL